MAPGSPVPLTYSVILLQWESRVEGPRFKPELLLLKVLRWKGVCQDLGDLRDRARVGLQKVPRLVAG